ncbi:MAG: hypothetical protein ACREIV_14650, partial [Planctomycetaceae bacterium]
MHIAPHAGGRDIDVLVLTQDEDFLETIRDSSHEAHTMHHANTPAQAEAIVHDHKVGVLVTDAAMVGSNIEAITERLRKDAPRLVAVVAGRRDDGELLMDLINRGQVYRFLLKPVSPGRARLAIEASVKHHLEAGDAAFKAKPRPDTAVPKDEQKAPKTSKIARLTPKIGPRPQPLPTATPTGQAARPPADSAKKGPVDDNAFPEAPNDGLDGAFGDSGRFTRTMTGLAATVGKSLGGSPDTAEANAATEDGPSAAGGPPARSKPKLLAIGGSAAVVIALLVWWLGFADSTPPGTTPNLETDTEALVSSPSVVESDIPAETPAEASQPDLAVPAYQSFLDQARMAREAGEIVVPPGSNAIELYV